MILYLLFDPSKLLNISDIAKRIGNFFKLPILLFYTITYPELASITFSAAESFVIDMKESGNVVLIGEPTAGDTGNRPKTFKTSNGMCFRIPTASPSVSPQGFPLEGIGVAPDYFISQTVSDFIKNRDAQLEFAKQYLTAK